MDILSCWNRLWVEWGENYCDVVALKFTQPEITELTECDTCGPGISMFNKRIVMNPQVLETVMWPRSPNATDMAFSVIAAMESGSRSYYLPAHGKLRFHGQWKKAAIWTHASYFDDLFALYKSLLNRGYQPVLGRPSSRPGRGDSPERRAARTLPIKRFPW